MLLRLCLLVAFCAVFLPATAQATTINLIANMDCVQANAGAGTCAAGGTGTGTATITLDDVTNLLTWSITWSGLSGVAALMHFHGPALPNQNAGVQVGTGVAGPPVIGNTVIDALQENDLLAGLWYLNLHTNTFTGGEIRGQVVAPEPGTFALLAIAIAAAGLLGRRQQPV
jgi:hypothetical protein